MFTLNSFYRSKEWESFRQVIINERTKEDGFIYDEITGDPIIQAYDIILHHVTPLTEMNVNDYSISFNPDNIQIVSHKTHNIIHQRFGYEGSRHIYLVYGSPCSGKSTYVKNVAGADDLILDIDKIYKCISNNEEHIKSKRISSCVFKVRDLLLDIINTRNGKWKNAYIIGGYPYEGEREKLCTALGAEAILIEASKEECIARAKENRPKEYIKYIEDWFNTVGVGGISK